MVDVTLITTLNLLRDARACKLQYHHLCVALGGTIKYGHDTPITIEQILNLNGLEDALFALQAVPGGQIAARYKLALMFACTCTQYFLPLYDSQLPEHDCPRRVLDATRAYTRGVGAWEDMAVTWNDWICSVFQTSGKTVSWSAWIAVTDDSVSWCARVAAWAAWATRDACANPTDSAYPRELQTTLLRSYLRGEK